jgi:hypothetical protein
VFLISVINKKSFFVERRIIFFVKNSKYFNDYFKPVPEDKLINVCNKHSDLLAAHSGECVGRQRLLSVELRIGIKSACSSVVVVIPVRHLNANSKSKCYLCWQRRRLPQRMYNTPRRVLLAASISSLI